jgi:hypothetical protein
VDAGRASVVRTSIAVVFFIDVNRLRCLLTCIKLAWQRIKDENMTRAAWRPRSLWGRYIFLHTLALLCMSGLLLACICRGSANS